METHEPMNTHDKLLELKRRRPFEPFKIHVADGRVYDVADPRLFVVMEDRIFYAYPDRKHGTFIHFPTITSIETPIAA